MDPVSSYDMEDVRGTDRDSVREIDLSWIVRSETATKDSLLKGKICQSMCYMHIFSALHTLFCHCATVEAKKKILENKKKKKWQIHIKSR